MGSVVKFPLADIEVECLALEQARERQVTCGWLFLLGCASVIGPPLGWAIGTISAWLT
jgi:hypothetical protein